MKRDGTCIDGPISKVDSMAVTIQPYNEAPITIQRTNYDKLDKEMHFFLVRAVHGLMWRQPMCSSARLLS
jgi:hypothetical protein